MNNRYARRTINAIPLCRSLGDIMTKPAYHIPSWSPILLSVLRFVTAFMFVQHGSAKLFQIPHVPMFDGVKLMSLAGVAGMFEVSGGVLLLLGLFTRPVAFILSGEMAFAYFIAHGPHSLLPVLNGGELAVEWCFVFLYIWVAGPGAFSVDGLQANHRRRRVGKTVGP